MNRKMNMCIVYESEKREREREHECVKERLIRYRE